MLGKKSKEKNYKTERNGAKGGIDLSDVIKGMQNAVSEAQKTLEMHNLNSLQQFFYDDGEPKTLELHLSEDNYLEVPVLSIASHNSLVIDALSMEFDAKIQQVEIKETEDAIEAITREGDDEDIARNNSDRGESSNHSARFSVGFSGEPDSNSVKVKIEFRATDRAEGLSRILDEYNKLIVPFKAIEGEDNSTWNKHGSNIGIHKDK